MYGYVYKTTNLVNGKIYIGQHKSEVFDVNYLGSGKSFTNALKKYGKNNFTCEILEWCDTQSIANSKEQYWINFYNSRDRKIGYNITIGGEGWTGLHHSKETKIKISKSKTGKHPNRDYIISKDTKDKISNTLKEYYKTHNNPRKGAHLSDETKEKLRQANLGKKLSDDAKARLCGRTPWNKGIHMTEEAKQHLSKVLSGRKSTMSESEIEKRRQQWIENNPNKNGLSESTKQKLRETFAGRVWVANDELQKQKQIRPEDLSEYISQGYHKGRLKYKDG